MSTWLAALRIAAARHWAWLLILSSAPFAQPQVNSTDSDPSADERTAIRFYASPQVHELYALPTGTDAAAISDIVIGDLDRDGRNDVVIAWFATDYDDLSRSRRFLSIFWGTGTTSVDRIDFDLFIPDPWFEPLSIFRNGTSSVALGDFDGDGDQDIAVLPFFGDEIWFLENLGQRQFHGVVKYPFGINTTGNFITPPRALAADFDGDGRDELVYIVDSLFYVDGRIIHFWSTGGAIDDMERAYWEPVNGSVNTTNTRVLAVADFDGDGHPDLCFAGGAIVGDLQNPVLTFWTNYNHVTASFTVTNIYPDFFVTDLLVLPPAPGCRPGVMVFDNTGANARPWNPSCSGPLAFAPGNLITGLAGGSYDQGVSAIMADVDDDNQLEIVIKQKLGTLGDPHKVDFLHYVIDGTEWYPIPTSPIDASGFVGDVSNPLLQPRDLAAGDLFGNSLPELVASWGSLETNPAPGTVGSLRIAIWQNDCIGDASLDGRTDMNDLQVVLANYGDLAPFANPNADLNKDGIVGLDDLSFVMSNYGCTIGR